MKKLLQDKINEASNDICAQIEEYIKLALKPKPKWIPNFVYKWIVKTFCVIERWGQQITFSESKPELLTSSHIKKATLELDKINSKFYQEIGHLYGIKIVVDDTLPPDYWEMRCGRNIARKIKETAYESGIYDLKKFIGGNNVDKN